jgi:hypothetical protein
MKSRQTITAGDLDFVDTGDLVKALERRAEVMVLHMCPLSNGADPPWRSHWGVDGGKSKSVEACWKAMGFAQMAQQWWLKEAERELRGDD